MIVRQTQLVFDIFAASPNASIAEQEHRMIASCLDLDDSRTIMTFRTERINDRRSLNHALSPRLVFSLVCNATLARTVETPRIDLTIQVDRKGMVTSSTDKRNPTQRELFGRQRAQLSPRRDLASELTLQVVAKRVDMSVRREQEYVIGSCCSGNERRGPVWSGGKRKIDRSGLNRLLDTSESE